MHYFPLILAAKQIFFAELGINFNNVIYCATFIDSNEVYISIDCEVGVVFHKLHHCYLSIIPKGKQLFMF